MATINLATKFSPKVAERFSHASFTDAYAGKEYDFSGVKSIKIYSVDTVAMTDYSRTGTTRFGTLEELGDSVQEMTMTKDRAFTFSIDKGNQAQQYNIKAATKALKREIDEVTTPEIDKYRMQQWAAGKGLTNVDASLTKSNILEAILTGSMKMSNELVPKKNRALFIKESLFLYCKLADQIVGIDSLGEKAITNGAVGTIDQMKVIPVPDSYFPANTNFIIKYKGCSVDPIQLKTYRILTDQMGVDGDVVEGRVIYDSFVITTKNKGIFTSTTE